MKLIELHSILLEAAPLYRGYSAANRQIDPNITWFSSDKDLASSYSNEGKVFSIDSGPGFSFDAGSDGDYISPFEFANKAIEQVDAGSVSANDAVLIKADFLDKFASAVVNKKTKIINFRANDSEKETVSDFLEDLGFDSIKLREEGIDTFGMIRMNANV